MSFLSCEEMLAAARSQNISLSEAILRSDLAESRLTEARSRESMHHLWQVMQATSREYDPTQRSRSGLSGGDAAKVEQAHREGRLLGGDYLSAVTAEALKTAECNACMKRIVAAPTAGSCGVLPAVLLPLARSGEADEDAICDALYVANDMGMNQRTLLSPAQFREFFFPSMKKQIETWKKAGGRVLLHSCGNIDAILEDLADMGIDAINNIQVRAGMDLASTKKRIGDRVTIVGNVDATGIMCQSDQQLIADAIQDVIDIAGQDGGLIIATDHSFHEGVPTENVIYFLNKAKELGVNDVCQANI